MRLNVTTGVGLGFVQYQKLTRIDALELVHLQRSMFPLVRFEALRWRQQQTTRRQRYAGTETCYSSATCLVQLANLVDV